MNRIAFMVSKMILLRFVAILLGLTLFVVTLEIVSYANEVLAIEPNNSFFVAKYFLTRAPATLVTFLPMSLLLALLLTVTELSYRNELTAIWATGISPLRLIAMLVPVALLAGALQFILSDRLVPAVAPTLRTWAVADYGDKQIRLGEKDPLWLRSGTDIMRAAKASEDSKQLEDVVIFRRNEDGILQQQIFASTATLTESGWQLNNVITYDRGNNNPRQSAQMTYEADMRPAEAGSRTGDPEEMTLGDLAYFVDNDGFGIRAGHVFNTFWHKRVATIVIPLVMVGLCIPLATRFRRGGGLGYLFAFGVGLGFAFFVLDGISVSVGEMGIITPWLAAWFPVLLFSAISIYLISKTQSV